MSPDTAHIVTRLQAALNAPGLPAKASATGTSLVERLSNPVRIGVFGFPGMGKRLLINSLLGEDIIDPALPLPTLELVPADTAETHAILPDGTTLCTAGYPGEDLLHHGPMFLQVKAPAPQLAGRSFLLAATDKTREDMSAALTWAATRVDVSIWCTQSWTGFEEDIWQAAPDGLRHHALLVVSDASVMSQSTLPGRLLHNGFLSAFDGACTRDLLDHLQGMIDEATAEDLDAAQMFLHRHGVPLPPVPPVPASVPAPTPVPQAVAPIPAQPDPAPEPEAITALSRLFQILRSDATVLHNTLPQGGDAAEFGLGAIERLFEKMANTVSTQDMLEDTWPDLCDGIFEARDQSLLMRIEGGAEQFDDAAHLLLQVRQDIETRLAA